MLLDLGRFAPVFESGRAESGCARKSGFATDSALEEAGFEPSVPPRDRDRLQHLQACIPDGKWVPVPCRYCRVAPISRSCGRFEPENLGGKAMTEKTVRPRSVLRRTMLAGTAGVIGGVILRPTSAQ